jgi:hypothetical protein
MGDESSSSTKIGSVLSIGTSYAVGFLCATVFAFVTLVGAQSTKAEEREASLATVRTDVSEVLQALAYRALGMELDAIGQVGFHEQIGSLADPTGLSYDAFYLQKIALTRFEEKGADEFELRGMMKYSDAMGRNTYLGIGADYVARNGAVFVQNAATEPVYPPHGDLEVMISRSGDLSSFEELKGLELEEAYLQMLQNGIDLDDAPLSRSGPERLTLLILDNVRQREGTGLDILYRGGARPDVKSLSRHNQDGWAYILLEADFPPNEGSEFELFRLSGMADGPEPISLGSISLDASN